MADLETQLAAGDPAAFEAALNELRWHRYHAREWASGVRSVQVRLAED